MTIPVLKKIAADRKVEFSITVFTKSEAAVIRELCPELKIDFIYFSELIHSSGYIKAFLILIKKIRAFSPDIILTQFEITSYKSSIISFLSGINIRVGWKGSFSFLNSHTITPSGLHKLEENLKVLKVLNIDISLTDIKYPGYLADINKINHKSLQKVLTSDFIKIAIGAGSKEQDKQKRWPATKFGSLIDKILVEEKDAYVIILGNQNERKICDEIAKNVKDKQRLLNVAGEISVVELINLLGFVDLTITNCNGISHLACAANSYIIGLYGPTNFRITGPISDRFTPITAGIDCSPCFSRAHGIVCDDPVCMESIMVDDVYSKAVAIINRLPVI